MKNSPHRMKHEQKKAIREAQKQEAETDPSEISEKQKKTYLSSPENLKKSKAKISSKHKHHMSSPDEVSFHTEPESIHQEGKKWIKTIQKQTLDAASKLQKKFQKFSNSKRKK